MAAFEKQPSIGSPHVPSALERDFRKLLRRASFELVIALGLPLLILLGSVGSLVYFMHSVNHSDQILARMNHAATLMETMESNLRGYGLTRQKVYLDNCIAARAKLDPTLAGLEAMVSDPGQKALVVQFRSQANELAKYVDESLGRLAGKKTDANLPKEIEIPQNVVDTAMDSAEKFLDNELMLREAHYSWFGKSRTLTAIVFLLLAFTVIPAILYRHRMALKQVGAMYHASLQNLAQSNERFRLFTAIVDVYLWTANPRGELDYLSERGIDFLGDPNVLGHSWFRYVHPDDMSRVYHLWEESIKTGAPYEIEARFRFRTGEYRWLLNRSRCMKDAQGQITTWFGATTDIDALKKAQENALDANRAKDDFLAALSHELRNPLNPALLLASEEAENPELTEPVRSSFSTILKNIETEARLIDDLLDLTRIGAGKLSLHRQLVDVHKIFMEALAYVQPDQFGKKIDLTVDWDAQKNGVNGDPVRLQQIFWNILKNAVKFTPAQGSVRVKASNAPDSQVVIKVTDSGIGMKPGELSRLFNPFAQGDHAGKAGSHVYGGLGLGLAIAKNLADMHAGTIRAESEGTNKGSTFIVELPLAA